MDYGLTYTKPFSYHEVFSSNESFACKKFELKYRDSIGGTGWKKKCRTTWKRLKKDEDEDVLSSYYKKIMRDANKAKSIRFFFKTKPKSGGIHEPVSQTRLLMARHKI